MNKEQFTKRMRLIQNFHSEQDTLRILINKITDGHLVVDFGNYLVDEIVDMINESMGITDKDLIEWWLYEHTDKVIYYEDKEISVRTIEELYDYIARSS